jgi:hypothetical protein
MMKKKVGELFVDVYPPPFSARELPAIKRTVIVQALNLVYNLVDATERTLGVSPRP